MFRFLSVLALVFLQTGCPNASAAQDIAGDRWTPPQEFQFVTEPLDYLDTHQQQNSGNIHMDQLPAVSPVLIGGRAATAGEFPATVYASMSNARCSANVVGKRVLIIAAHCVGNGKTASFTINGSTYNSVCTHSSDYANNSTADWALCKTSTDVQGIEYERINVDRALVKIGDEITLTGYGCINPGGGGGNDGILRVGTSKATRTPSGTNYDIVTQGNAALCYGDSGGPAYVYLDADKKGRVQVSVNSRGDIRTTSYLSSTANDAFRKFVGGWILANQNVKICGIDDDAEGCRPLAGEPPPEGELPAWCAQSREMLNDCIFGNPPKAKSDFEGCRDQYANLFACMEMAGQGETN